MLDGGTEDAPTAYRNISMKSLLFVLAALSLSACGGRDAPTPTFVFAPLATLTPDIPIFATPNPEINDGVVIGRLVAARGIDAHQCAVNAVTRFPEDSEAVYIVAENSDVPRHTAVFVRLFHNGTPLEDTEAIIAAQEYENICMSFTFVDEEEGFFRSGEYTAQLFADQILRASVNFIVR